MDISFDAAKNDRNIALRGISFERAMAFEWDGALIVEDAAEGLRRDADFRRFGLIRGRLHMLVFTPRTGKRMLSVFGKPTNGR